MNDVLLLAATLILSKSHAIERLFHYIFLYDDTFIISFFEPKDSLGSEFTTQDTLDTLKPLCIPVRQVIMMVRCEDRPGALDYLDFKEEDLTDIIEFYYKVDYCIRTFPHFINMNHLPESLMSDFAKTSMIEDKITVVNPWNLQNSWNLEFPPSEQIPVRQS